MSSEAKKYDPITLLQRGWSAFRLERDQYRILDEKALSQKTVIELVNGPYIIRVDTPTEGRVYYVGTDEPYLKLTGEGKTVKWLHDLFEAIRQDLIQRGYPEDTSIYRWSTQFLWANQAAINVFPGSKIEVRE